MKRIFVFPTFALLIGGSVFAQISGEPILKLSSSDFGEGGNIPARFTCEGQNISPTLTITGVPEAAKSLALVMEDSDAPAGTFTHWIVWNIKTDVKEIVMNTAPRDAVQGMNDAHKNNYFGPCPPSGNHRYYFKLYALDIGLTLPTTASRKAFDAAIDKHVLKEATLMGRYAKGEGAQ